jgi:hypothetical protein
MTKYMKMEQAFKCGDDDIPFLEEGWNSTGKLTLKYILDNQVNFPTPNAIASDKWQVIKAEPKVLTAEEIEEIARKQGPVDGIWNADCVHATVRNTIALCHKYFSLKEWNRTKELREAAELIIDGKMNSGLTLLSNVMKTLKPPCQ